MLVSFLAILFPVLSVVLFKLFSKYNVYAFASIVLNYVVAASICLALFPDKVSVQSLINEPWIIYSSVLGFAFIFNFFLISKSAHSNGVSFTTLANKISLVVPVVLGVIISSESFGIYKLIGMLIAILAIYMVTLKNKGVSQIANISLLILVFTFTGVMEFCLGYVEQTYFVNNGGMELFIMATFISAFCIGIIPFIINIKKVGIKELVGGALLGVTNGLGVYYLFQALNTNQENGVVFSIVNLGSLLLASLVGWLVFKEKLSVLNGIGILLAMGAIYLFNLS